MGGGEKYLFDIASCFPEDEIIFLCEDKEILKIAKERFDFNHKNIKVVTDFKESNGKLDKNIVRHVDNFFYQCDGSLFFGPAKKNILLIQSPAHTPKFSWLNKLKSLTWQKVVCNSGFTAHFVRKNLFVTPTLLNPAILPVSPLTKKNVILAVGRFFPHLHSKKQEVLIDVFKKLACPSVAPPACGAKEDHSRPALGGVNSNGNLMSYRLALAGAVAESDVDYLKKLKEQAEGYPIDFYENASYEKIKELYGEAKIFWHAAGFGEDLKKYPERAEHFGISTVEAISASCYPLVFKAGGQTEILSNHDEFYWTTKEELANKTLELIKNDELPTRNASHSDAGGVINNLKKIKDIPRNYSFENFKRKLYEILQ